MRDPNRIDGILAQLGKLWKEFPDLRLGQLIANTDIHKNEGLFYNIEDQDFVNYLIEYYEGMAPRGTLVMPYSVMLSYDDFQTANPGIELSETVTIEDLHAEEELIRAEAKQIINQKYNPENKYQLGDFVMFRYPNLRSIEVCDIQWTFAKE